jgi:hypothetical protein
MLPGMSAQKDMDRSGINGRTTKTRKVNNILAKILTFKQ